jgi:hypothetical protein
MNKIKYFLYLLFFSGFLSSDIFHYQKLFQGDSATFLGGAYTALSQDTAGMYNNPAGFAYSTELISASIQAYNYSNLVFKNGNLETGEDYSQTSQGTSPTMFSYIVENEVLGGKVGLAFFTEEVANINQNETSKSASLVDPEIMQTTQISLQKDYSVMNLGGTYSTKFNNGFSMGLSLFGVIRNTQYINKQFRDWYYLNTNNAPEIENSIDSLYVEDKQYGVKPIIGLLYKIGKHSVGLSSSQEYILMRNYKAIYNDFYKDESTFIKLTSEEIPLRPININIGYAFQGEKFGLSLDAKYYSAVTKVSNGQSDITANTFEDNSYIHTTEEQNLLMTEIESIDVLNLSLGLLYKFNSKNILRLGFFTDMANTNQEILENYLYSEKIDLYGLTGGYSFKIDKKEFTFGFLLSSGVGEVDTGILSINSSEVEQTKSYLFLNYKL